MMERRRALGGSIPKRIVRPRRPFGLPTDSTFEELRKGSGEQSVSTTMGFTRLLRNLCRDENIGQHVVPIIPDEGRTFGMDSLFPALKIYASQGQKYSPVDHDLLLSYAESAKGQILEEGITEAGSLASFIAAGTAYATRGVPTIPFYTFYSMFGFQRVGDLIWQAADARARGFLMGATAGRTTLLGEGLQHQDGHSLVLASTVPPVQAYDPAFAYEVGAIVQAGIHRMYSPDSTDPDVFYYITLYNENYPMPAMPEGLDPAHIVRGLYRWQAAPEGTERRATVLFSGSASGAARAAAQELLEQHGIGVELWSATSYKALRDDALAVERWNRLHPDQTPRTPVVADAARRRPGTHRRRHRLHEDRARAGRPLPARPHLRAARHRRHGPQRHPRGAAPLLRGRRRSRGGRCAQRAARRRQGRRRRSARRDGSPRHRCRRGRPAHTH